MSTLQSLSEVKNKFVEVLQMLPKETILPSGEGGSGFTKISLSEVVGQDIEQLENFWEFLAAHQHTNVIALVGMVNTGKSALGNHLLGRGESDVFEEAPIRETSQAHEAKLDEKTVIIDLPGLGSVLSEEDDAIVKRIIQRANLLLLVLDVMTDPTPKHLYDFLNSKEVLKSKELQQIVIVINKIDGLADLPPAVQQKQIQRYIDFLQRGNKNMKFEGIAKLFDYEIPIVPFSVREARKHPDSERERELRQMLNKALKAGSSNAIKRAEINLSEVAKKYVTLIASYVAIRERHHDLEKQTMASMQSVAEQIDSSIQSEFSTLAERIERIRNSCFQELQNYTTDGTERFFQGPNFQSKKAQSIACRDQHRDEIEKEFYDFVRNLRGDISNAARSLPGGFQIKLPNSDEIVDELKSSIWEIWDAYDDYWFLDKDRDAFEHSIEQSKEHLEKAVRKIDAWLSKLVQRISKALEAQTASLSQDTEYAFLKAHADALEAFCNAFVAIDYFKPIFSSDS